MVLQNIECLTVYIVLLMQRNIGFLLWLHSNANLYEISVDNKLTVQWTANAQLPVKITYWWHRKIKMMTQKLHSQYDYKFITELLYNITFNFTILCLVIFLL